MRRFRVVVFLLLLTGCEFLFQDGADEKIGARNFKSASALIELHNVRNGIYPNTLDQLEYLGDWDAIWHGAVNYTKTEDGYNLFVERGWVGKPELSLFRSFREGLGLRDSRILWIEWLTRAETLKIKATDC